MKRSHSRPCWEIGDESRSLKKCYKWLLCRTMITVTLKRVLLYCSRGRRALRLNLGQSPVITGQRLRLSSHSHADIIDVHTSALSRTVRLMSRSWTMKSCIVCLEYSPSHASQSVCLSVCHTVQSTLQLPAVKPCIILTTVQFSYLATEIISPCYCFVSQLALSN